MANQNINERRDYVKKLLDDGLEISSKMRREIAKIFACSTGAIHMDIIQLTRKGETTPFVSAGMRRRIFARDGRKCRYCGTTQAHEFIIDHVVPQSMGGLATLDNLVVACGSCNVRKKKQVWTPNPL